MDKSIKQVTFLDDISIANKFLFSSSIAIEFREKFPNPCRKFRDSLAVFNPSTRVKKYLWKRRLFF